MAKRKKSKKRHSKRVGSMLNPKSPVVKLLAVAGGFLLGDTINPFLDTLIPDSLTTATPATATTPAKPATLSPDNADQILMAGQIGIGSLVALKVKQPLIALAGAFLAGTGAQRAAVSFNIIKPKVAGYQRTPVLGRTVRGYQRTPVLGKTPAQLAKVPGQLQGYRVNGYEPNGSGVGVMGSLYTNSVANDNAAGSGIQNAGSAYMN